MMDSSISTSIISQHFGTPLRQTWPKTISGLGRAIYTVFATPSVPGHDDSIYIDVAKGLRNQPIPLQPPFDEELIAISNAVTMVSQSKRRLTNREMLGIMGVLMQFTSYIPTLLPYSMTPFEDTERLYEALVTHASKAPLDFSQQLTIALEQTSGNIIESLWRLFITARMYARWFDSGTIVGMPSFSRRKILNRMDTFSRSVAACKQYGTCPDQDSGGDTYYCWTHAFAKVLYKSYAPKISPIASLEAFALHNGTQLNHGLAHRYRPQRLKSDHTIAASYGNAIGEALLQLF